MMMGLDNEGILASGEGRQTTTARRGDGRSRQREANGNARQWPGPAKAFFFALSVLLGMWCWAVVKKRLVVVPCPLLSPSPVARIFDLAIPQVQQDSNRPPLVPGQHLRE